MQCKRLHPSTHRDAPVLDPSGSKLTLLADGNLVLLSNLSRTPVWSTNLVSNTLHTPEVVLGDDGNLVLKDGSNPNVVFWQSFDYPTDTILPGGKIGFSRKTNQTQQLISWRSREDPATGFYNNDLGPNRKFHKTLCVKGPENVNRELQIHNTNYDSVKQNNKHISCNHGNYYLPKL